MCHVSQSAHTHTGIDPGKAVEFTLKRCSLGRKVEVGGAKKHTVMQNRGRCRGRKGKETKHRKRKI